VISRGVRPAFERFHRLRPEFRPVRRTSLADFGASLSERIGVRFWGQFQDKDIARNHFLNLNAFA
jgi:hypothetical protein